MKKRILTIIQSHDIIAKTAEKGTGRMSLGIEEDNKKTDEPDIDIHIIPDTVKTENYQKRSFTWYMEKPSAKDYFLTVFIFAVCTLIGLLFQKLDFTDTNIVTIYILGVLLTSIVTDGYLCSVAGSFLSVFLFCFFLTEPRMSFQTYAVGYPVTFFIMLISSVLTGALAAKLKTHAKLSTQLAFRTQILFDTDRLLQKAKGEREILDVTCTQLLRLLNRNITAYVVENGTLSEGKLFSGEKGDTEDFLTPEEQQTPEWAALYEDKNNKAEDAKSSAIALILVGGIGVVFIVALVMDYLPIHLFGLGKYLISGIMTTMFLVFIGMGVSSIKTYKKYLGIAEEEQKNIEQIMDLLAQHMSKEVIDAKLAGEPEEMPQIYYSRLALIKEFLEAHYGGLEPALLEKLADDWYEELYGESDEELLSEESDEESVEESSEEDEETAENEE